MHPDFSRQLTKDRANKITGQMAQDIHESDREYILSSYNAALYTAKKCGWTVIDCVKDGKIRTIEDINDEIYETVINNA